MKITSSKYVANATSFEACPRCDKPEFAFIGRSNVGKSSLINALTNNKKLAKVSGTPGKTRMINFFTINDSFHLVDLPGYGFAKVSMDQNVKFHDFTADYLAQRECLKCVFVLVDARQEPQEIDLDFLYWIQQFERDVVLVFTKSDLADKDMILKNVGLFQAALEELEVAMPEYLSCSSTMGVGKTPVFDHIEPHLPKIAKKETSRRKNVQKWKGLT